MTNGQILITGANGFLGREIVRQLAASFFPLLITDQRASSIMKGVEYRSADICRIETIQPLFKEITTVIHSAGLAHVMDHSRAQMAPFHEVNVIGTENVARAAAQAGVRHFILISSISVYGSSVNGGAEDSGCYPNGPYAVSKYQAERRAIEMAEATGMGLTVLRLATLYGAGDPGNVARLMRTIDRKRFIWIGDGSNHKSLLHCEDAAKACLAVIKKPTLGVNIYNVSAPSCTMREVVEGLAGALGKQLLSKGIPASFVLGVSRMLSAMPINRLRISAIILKKWLADDVYDGSKFAEAFDFQTQVSLKEGLCQEVAWYQKEQAKRGY